MKFKEVSITSDGLSIEFSNGIKDCFPFLWLRDHCKDDVNWDERSSQRKLFTALIDPNIKASDVKIIQDSDELEVKWPDMESAVLYSSKFLFKNSFENNHVGNSLRFACSRRTLKYNIFSF